MARDARRRIVAGRCFFVCLVCFVVRVPFCRLACFPVYIVVGGLSSMHVIDPAFGDSGPPARRDDRISINHETHEKTEISRHPSSVAGRCFFAFGKNA
jgi:hypothetical protein